MPEPSLTTEYVLAVIANVVGLFVTQGYIDNGVEKLVSGLAAVFVPLVLLAVRAYVKSRAHAAQIQADATRAAGRQVGQNR